MVPTSQLAAVNLTVSEKTSTLSDMQLKPYLYYSAPISASVTPIQGSPTSDTVLVSRGHGRGENNSAHEHYTENRLGIL